MKFLNNLNPSMVNSILKDDPSPLEFMKQIPVFRLLEDSVIEEILKDSQELMFQQDTYIVKEHDLIKGMFLAHLI